MRGERVEEGGEAVFEAEVFAVAGGVLADEGDLVDAAGDQLLGFRDDGFESARAEFAAQVGDDAEGAGMVAAFGDFDVGGGFGGGEEARRGFVVEVGGQQVGCALPVVAAEAALLLAVVSFGAGLLWRRPQGLKPDHFAVCGTTEVVPFQSLAVSAARL